jgi:hypothetical protein
MRIIALLAVITALSTGAWCGRAQSMPLAAPPVLGVQAAAAPLLERVANVCGIGGCAPVWTKRVHKPPPSFVKMAVPMTVVQPPRNTAPLK